MKKDVKFSTRMASTDREAIKELAKQSGMSMSDYVTACCLGKQVVVIDGLKEVLKELKSIGRNLNQLGTLAHNFFKSRAGNDQIATGAIEVEVGLVAGDQTILFVVDREANGYIVDVFLKQGVGFTRR